MLETIAKTAKESPFLSTPRSMMMAGSWACDSPRVFLEPPRRPMSMDAQDKNQSIDFPKLEGPNDSKAKQRDAPDDASKGIPPSGRKDIATVGSEAQDGRFECDYDKNATDLFLHLQRKEWEKAEPNFIQSLDLSTGPQS